MEMLQSFEHPCLIVAHPDDETLSSSQLLQSWSDRVHVVFATGDDIRSQEAHAALAHIEGLARDRIHFLEIDESLIYEFTDLFIKRIRKLLEVVRPDVVITHAFEGGHFDHDLVSFVVERIHAEAPENFLLAQFALYFCKDGVHSHNVFLDPRSDDVVFFSDVVAITRKQRMMAEYATQRDILRFFDPSCPERMRLCLPDDSNPRRFLKRPHSGSIGYDHGFDAIKNWELFLETVSCHL